MPTNEKDVAGPGKKAIKDLPVTDRPADAVKGGRAIDDINDGAVADLRDIVRRVDTNRRP